MDAFSERFEQAMHTSERARHGLLAMVDDQGGPQLVAVEESSRAGEQRIAVRAWVDLPPSGESDRVSVLLWDDAGRGYQLAGRAVRAEDAGVLNGLAEVEQQEHFPQVERSILIHVESVEEFQLADLQHRWGTA